MIVNDYNDIDRYIYIAIWSYHHDCYEITLWWTNIAIENGPVEIVDFPINSMVIFHSYVTVYQRVCFISMV